MGAGQLAAGRVEWRDVKLEVVRRCQPAAQEGDHTGLI